jgi:hypothetical protein
MKMKLARKTESARHRCPCGKLSYTKVAAENALREAQERGRSEQRIYKCQITGSWHLTSQDG